MPSPGAGQATLPSALQSLQKQIDRLARRLIDLAHLDQSGAANGEVPVWNDTLKVWEAGSVVPLTPAVYFAQVQSSSLVSYSGQSFLKVALPTVVRDPLSLWDTTNYWYTVPVDGVYEVTGSFRFLDNYPVGLNFSLGVAETTGDGDHMIWQTTTNATAGSADRRLTLSYHRIGTYTAGDRLRVIAYFDTTGSTTLSSLGASFRLITTNV